MIACNGYKITDTNFQQIKPLHIIKTRSIDLNNAHGLAMESRLEKAVEPTGYRLELEPYLEDAVFKGKSQVKARTELALTYRL